MADEKKIMDQVAEENKVTTSNGNQAATTSEKTGGAEKGGPALEKARDRQPPDAQTPFQPSEQEK